MCAAQTMADVLLNLPTDIAVEVISKWVGIAEAVNLDTAFCATATRSKLKVLLSNCTLCWTPHQQYHTNDIATWSVKRNVCVNSLHLNKDSDLHVYKELLKKGGSRVFRVRYEMEPTEKYNDLLNNIAIYCPHLEELDLLEQKECPGLGVPLKNIILNCPQLRTLNFTSTAITLGLDPCSLHGIICPNLHTMRLDFFHPVELIAAFLTMAPNLTSLTLLMCSFELDKGGTVLQFLSPTLIKLCIVGLTDNELIQIVDVCPRIESITFLNAWYGATNVTVTGVEYMAKNLTALNTVNFNSANISNECLLALAEHRLHTLTSLDIVHCYYLFDATINAVLEQCIKLTHFGCNYSYHTKYLDFALLVNAKELYFDMEDEYTILLHYIAQHCRALTRLSLESLPETGTLYGLEKIISNCAQLVELNIKRSRICLRKETILQWKSIRPRLVVTEYET